LKNYYLILEVHPNARKEVIQASYRILAKVYHPDNGGGNKDIMLDINEAYEVLTDEHKRSSYDKKYKSQNEGVISVEMQSRERELNLREKEILRREKFLSEKEESLNIMREREKKAKIIKKCVELEDKIKALRDDALPLNLKYSYLKDIISEGKKSIPSLKKGLYKTDKENRYFIVQALAEINGEDNELFIDLLNDDYPPIRAEALRVLGENKASSASRYVALLLDDSASAVREQACAALFNLGYEDASDKLIELSLDKKEDKKVRLAALKAFSRCGDILRKDDIKDLIGQKDKDISSEASKTLFLLEQKEIFLSRKTGSL
jgi:curved DNA-binding protein CbpA